ncbi:MAG: cytochrome c oxidase subunit II [Chloroflexota bacterium]|nr:cytochrome c oxidase subunit II [Chloroflexota bacterium]
MSEPNLVQGDTTSGASEQQQPRHLRRALLIWAVLSIIGIIIVVAFTKYVLPPSASDVGVSNDFTLLVFTALAVPVAMFVFVFLAYSMIVFRVHVEDKPTEDGAFLKPRPMLQVGWMGITGALCLFLLIWGLFGFYQNTVAAAPNPLIVQVTGQQWLWNFSYPQYGTASQILELPVNRAVEFSVTSKEVLHGFAIRSLGVRIDANPGQITTIPAITPTQIGTYSVACVELCGLYHSYMWATVKVVTTSSFNDWITNQGGHL